MQVYVSCDGGEYRPLNGPVEIGLDSERDTDLPDLEPLQASVAGELTFMDAEPLIDLFGTHEPLTYQLFLETKGEKRKTKKTVWMYRHDRKGRSRWIGAGSFEPSFRPRAERVVCLPSVEVTGVDGTLPTGPEGTEFFGFMVMQ